MNRLFALTAALTLLAPQAHALPTMIDCTRDSANARCVAKSAPDGVGAIGSGSTFYQGGAEQFRGGFVSADGQTLYLALETLRNTDPFGVVMAVDLNTGNRRVVSGYLNTMEKVGKGVKVQGDRDTLDLYTLGNIYDVQPLPDGSLLAHTGQLIRIDPRTGDRTLLWTPTTAGDTRVRDTVELKYADPRRPAQTGGAAPSAPGVSVPNTTVSTPIGNVNVGGLLGGLLGGPRPAAPAPAPAPQPTAPGNGYFCTQLDPKAVTPALPHTYMATDAEGNVYMMGSNSPIGSGFALFKLDAKNDYRCTSVSRFDVSGDNVQGSGIPWTSSLAGTGPIFGDFAVNGTTLYASGGPNPNYIVVSVDMKTGERRLISGQTDQAGAQVFKKGQGAAHIGSALVYSGGALYTTQAQVSAEPFALVRIDPATGDRTLIEPPKGTPLSKGRASSATLYPIPGSTQLIVGFDGALHVMDPATGLNYILSR
ncbi:hypothetical protein [Deinococcus arcticus]|uniref:Uncharacterized protein n=1 Tax=Deinococcus arcticus TaxID=2136176 RepID=A0A2T3WC46_9DEIO|nr:hypothetical protein [Deinococcus arcticus]PTA69468.1 hypothetical protein C8263_00045 [Deinococcus arcticus]